MAGYTAVVARLLFLLPVLMWAQTPAEIRLRVVDSHWSIVSAWTPGQREAVKAVRVDAAQAGVTPVEFPRVAAPPFARVSVLTVCEALDGRDHYNLDTVVIVGIFKSGTDETLRQDCPRQLVTGEVAWPNAVALSNPGTPPENLRDEIEKKRAEVIASYPREAQPRYERVVGLYGLLASPSGLSSVPCCRGSVETTIAPARLFGLGERDLRVIQ
jgi:hypothetical protein